MARVFHDLIARDRVLSLRRWLRRLLGFTECSEFRVSYVDETHVFVRNKDRSVMFMKKLDRAEVNRLLPSGTARVYVLASYKSSRPRDTWLIWDTVEGGW